MERSSNYIGGVIAGADKTGIVSDYTGMDKGIMQKILDIKKALEDPMPTVDSAVPYIEDIAGGVYVK